MTSFTKTPLQILTPSNNFRLTCAQTRTCARMTHVLTDIERYNGCCGCSLHIGYLHHLTSVSQLTLTTRASVTSQPIGQPSATKEAIASLSQSSRHALARGRIPMFAAPCSLHPAVPDATQKYPQRLQLGSSVKARPQQCTLKSTRMHVRTCLCLHNKQHIKKLSGQIHIRIKELHRTRRHYPCAF